jgi:hypothetical protein
LFQRWTSIGVTTPPEAVYYIKSWGQVLVGLIRIAISLLVDLLTFCAKDRIDRTYRLNIYLALMITLGCKTYSIMYFAKIQVNPQNKI